jgi:hypothetical protein
MANQEPILSIKRVAAEFLKAVDPNTGQIKDLAPLGFAFNKAFAV